MLKVIGLEKAFDGLGVLRGISLEVRKGEVVAIIGRSGSGKSTLMRCVNNLERADGGTILVDDQALVKDGVYVPLKDQRSICLKMGYVFQNFNLFPHMSVLRNLTEAQVCVLKRDKEKAKKYARELLKRWAWRIRKPPIPASCREDSASALRSRGLLRSTRRFFSSMSRPARLIRSLPERC